MNPTYQCERCAGTFEGSVPAPPNISVPLGADKPYAKSYRFARADWVDLCPDCLIWALEQAAQRLKEVGA